MSSFANADDPGMESVPSFAGLVVIARSLYPIPSRTRPSKSSAPMVLSLKAWKSRSPPGLPRTERFILFTFQIKGPAVFRGAFSLPAISRVARSIEATDSLPKGLRKLSKTCAYIRQVECPKIISRGSACADLTEFFIEFGRTKIVSWPILRPEKSFIARYLFVEQPDLFYLNSWKRNVSVSILVCELVGKSVA